MTTISTESVLLQVELGRTKNCPEIVLSKRNLLKAVEEGKALPSTVVNVKYIVSQLLKLARRLSFC